ncbi:hypothetical protein ACWEPL_63980 [Nonomuraea sp. NPDC004186]
MKQAGTVRHDVDTRAVAYILDALTPALRRTFAADRAGSQDPDQPTSDELLEALADLLDRALAPADGGDLEKGKAVLVGGLRQVRAELATELGPEDVEEEGEGS